MWVFYIWLCGIVVYVCIVFCFWYEGCLLGMIRWYGGFSIVSIIYVCVYYRYVVFFDVVEGSWVDRILVISFVVNVVENFFCEFNIIICEFVNFSVIDI